MNTAFQAMNIFFQKNVVEFFFKLTEKIIVVADDLPSLTACKIFFRKQPNVHI
jgi:hypothetical protein